MQLSKDNIFSSCAQHLYEDSFSGKNLQSMVDDRIAQGFKGKDCKCEGSENVTHHIATCISIAHCLTSSLNSIKSSLSFMRFNKIMSKSCPTIGSVTRNCHIQSILAFQKLAMLGPTFSLFFAVIFCRLKTKGFLQKILLWLEAWFEWFEWAPSKVSTIR